jgi:hypothetical protein
MRGDESGMVLCKMQYVFNVNLLRLGAKAA